jgi:hypothetical protein
VNIINLALGVLVTSAGVIILLLVADVWKTRTGKATTLTWSMFISTDGLHAYWQRLRQAVRMHPVPILGWIETALWGVILLSVVDHVIAPRMSWTGQIVWALTIGPHEVGHFICNPFGTLIMFAGGSIWQVLFWFGLALVTLFLRRQVTFTMLLWAIVGHSFINLAVYIGDARTKQLPLLFGMGSEHHDWANILGMLNLLPFDTMLATLSTLLGIVIVVSAVVVGITTAWFLPRVGMGKLPRLLSGLNPLRALIDGVTGKQWAFSVETPTDAGTHT